MTERPDPSGPTTILVTGAAGYIGSHTSLMLLEQGHRVIALDNLSRASTRAIDMLGRLYPDRFVFERASVGDLDRVRPLVETHSPSVVMHFAALAYVGESVLNPLEYHRNNTAEGIELLRALDGDPIRSFVFSSSCATYGDPPEGMIPVPESCPQRPTSPYGETKLAFERVLRDWTHARAGQGRPIATTFLRYFNVSGADPKTRLGEHHDPETHLVPLAIQAAIGQRDALQIFGVDYPAPSPDGTCVRDYVHVSDLARAHGLCMALGPGPDPRAFNVGAGRGYSVREVLDAVEHELGRPVPCVEAPRRAGDAVALYADPALVSGELGWRPEHSDLGTIVRTAAAGLRLGSA